MKKLTRVLCLILCAVLLFSCDPGGVHVTDGTMDAISTDGTDTSDDTAEDTVKEIDPMADKQLETPAEENEFFYDSFTSPDGGKKWSPDDRTKVSFSGGVMDVSSGSADKDAVISRKGVSIIRDNFLYEFRLAVIQEGTRVGFVYGLGESRIYGTIYPDAVNVQTANGALDEIVLPIGNDFHTYSFYVDEGRVHFCFDGKYVTTYEPQKQASTVISFFAMAITSRPVEYKLDYTRMKPFENGDVVLTDIEDGGVYDGNSLTLTARVSNDIYESGTELQYLANGIPVGSSGNKGVSFSYDWEDIPDGSYYVVAKYGEAVSAPVLVTFGKSDISEPTIKNAKKEYSDAEHLIQSYELIFDYKGNNASLNSCDGFYLLDMSFDGGAVTVKTKEGDKKFNCGAGAYNVLVDTGLCNIFCGGSFIGSFLMPNGTKYQLPVYSGIDTVGVLSYNCSYYSFDTGAEKVCRVLDDFGDCYTVNIFTDSGEDGSLRLYDGRHKLDLEIKNGEMIVSDTPKLLITERNLGKMPEGKHNWRILVEGGIARIYCDNVWFDSVRLTLSSAERFICAEGEMLININSAEERYYNSIDFSKDAPEAFFDFSEKSYSVSGNALEISGELTAINRVSALDFEYVVDYSASGKSRGYVYLLARYTNARDGIMAGYNYDTGRYEMYEMKGKGQTLVAKANVSLPPNGTLRISVSGNTAVLFCNEKEVLTGGISVKSPAGTGIATDGNIKINFVGYSGDGFAQISQSTAYIDSGFPQIIELKDGRLLMAHGEKWISEDDGLTWESTPNRAGYTNNMLVLENGDIISIKQVGSNHILKDVAMISKDNGETWTEYPLQGKATYRITMNCKLTQAESGRIFYVSGASGHAVEHSSSVEVYYSDNGTIWKESKTKINYLTTGMNLQEHVIVDIGNGVLRMFARSDRGFLYYSDSTDNGVTWETEFHPSELASVESAFNVVRDRDTGILWMAWEYCCENDNGTVQYPRTRVSLALSRDSGKTWEFVADVDESFINQCCHWNIGIGVTSGCVFVTVQKLVYTESGGTETKSIVARLEKSEITDRTLARLSGLDRFASPEKQTKWYKEQLRKAIVVEDGYAVAAGLDYTDVKYDGMSTYIQLSRLAEASGMKLSGNNTLSLGKTKYVFEDKSNTVETKNGSINIESAAKKVDGELCITLSDAAALLGWAIYEKDGVSAIFYCPYPVDFGYIAANSHI